MGVVILTQHFVNTCQRKLRWCGTSYKSTTLKTALEYKAVLKLLIYTTLSKVQAGNPTHFWELNSIPNIGFYRILHTYFKRQLKSSTKVMIGRFYAAIDGNLREKGSRPDNIYHFVKHVVASKTIR